MTKILRKCLLSVFCLLAACQFLMADDNLPSSFTRGSLAQLQSQALQFDQAYLVYFYAKDSRTCKKMNRFAWSDQEVIRLVEENFLALGIDALSTDISLIQKFKVFDFPTILFFKSDGSIIGRTQGYLAPETLRDALNKYISALGKQPQQTLVASRGQSQPINMERAATETKLGPTITVQSGVMRPMDADPITVVRSGEDNKLDPTTQYQMMAQKQQKRGVDALKPVQTQAKTTRPDDSETSYQTFQLESHENVNKEISLNIATRGDAKSVFYLSATGFEEFSLNKLKKQNPDAALGLLVQSSSVFADVNQEVEKFQRFWQGDIWVYGEEISGNLVYHLVLGTYADKDEADIFSKIISEKTAVNNTILDLKNLIR